MKTNEEKIILFRARQLNLFAGGDNKNAEDLKVSIEVVLAYHGMKASKELIETIVNSAN